MEFPGTPRGVPPTTNERKPFTLCNSVDREARFPGVGRSWEWCIIRAGCEAEPGSGTSVGNDLV
jgi:hypothetical protein